MTDFLLWQAAVGEIENALALLKQDPPADPILRRHQMARAAKRLLKASHILVVWDELT